MTDKPVFSFDNWSVLHYFDWKESLLTDIWLRNDWKPVNFDQFDWESPFLTDIWLRIQSFSMRKGTFSVNLTGLSVNSHRMSVKLTEKYLFLWNSHRNWLRSQSKKVKKIKNMWKWLTFQSIVSQIPKLSVKKCENDWLFTQIGENILKNSWNHT